MIGAEVLDWKEKIKKDSSSWLYLVEVVIFSYSIVSWYWSRSVNLNFHSVQLLYFYLHQFTMKSLNFKEGAFMQKELLSLILPQ
jgi:hypothetical protein